MRSFAYETRISTDGRALANRQLTRTLATECEDWRREGDSNPRYPSGYSGFQDRRHRPLGHPSAYERCVESRAVWFAIFDATTHDHARAPCHCTARIGLRSSTERKSRGRRVWLITSPASRRGKVILSRSSGPRTHFPLVELGAVSAVGKIDEGKLATDAGRRALHASKIETCAEPLDRPECADRARSVGRLEHLEFAVGSAAAANGPSYG